MPNFKITETEKEKILTSESYNWILNKENGTFIRCGKTENDNIDVSPIGPELIDIEINTDCNGIHGTPCPWCYKSNTSQGKYMPFKKFVKIITRLNKYGNVHQIALGMGNINTHPHLSQILQWCNNNNITVNLTVNGANLDDKNSDGLTYAELFAKHCKAVAVSHYEDDMCFDAVKKLCDLGVSQVNIHQLLSEETFKDSYDVLKKVKGKEADERLSKLKAVMFLSLKVKGTRNTLTPLGKDCRFKSLVDFAFDNKIQIGFDTCGASRYLDLFPQFSYMVESCEAACFSSYVNVDGKYFPCSFCENEKCKNLDWTNGIDILKDNFDFEKDFWFNKKLVTFRNSLIKHGRQCPMFKI